MIVRVPKSFPNRTQFLRGNKNRMGTHAGSSAHTPHAVCVPFPSQGHINAMLQVAKLIHARGFHVTFVNTEFNHRRLLRSRGPHALAGLPSFQFETIPDGLPETDMDATQDVPSLCHATMRNCLAPFKELLRRINVAGGEIPPVRCVVADCVMTFTLDAAEELGVPGVLFSSFGGGGFMAFLQYYHFIERGLVPLKDESYLTNGYLDMEIDWVPSLRNFRLKDFPSFIRTTNPDDVMLRFFLHETDRAKRASAVIVNTFEDLEHEVIRSMQSILPPVYPVGPLHLLMKREIEDSEIGRLGSSLWKEDADCLAWLDAKAPNSVVYVNFGSITVITKKQLVEFAWGLAGSGKEFLWVIRPDLLGGEEAVVPPEFLTETANRRMLASWCPQEKVLSHSAVGVFLTHSGWNSTLESITSGVPMICWPFFGDQQTNCKFCCDEWGIGMQLSGDVKREEVEAVVREMMEGEKGKKMRGNAEEWRRLAVDAAAAPSGSSFLNFETMVHKVLLGQS